MLTKGTISQVSVGADVASVAITTATGGVGPYTNQWYRSTESGFTPAAGNLISGATGLALKDSGLIPNTQYYYKVVQTDTDNSATVESDQLAVATTSAELSQNTFAQQNYAGVLDLRLSWATVSCLIDLSQLTPLYAGAAVKVVDSADGVPKIVGCTAETDEVFGFINFDQKSKSFTAGKPCEISQASNVMYLYATEAISRGVQVVLDLATMGGVKAASGHTGETIVGYTFDKAAAVGALIRVHILAPSFLTV